MERNWKVALSRAVFIISVYTVILYEIYGALKNGVRLRNLLPFGDGIIFTIEFVIIPVCFLSSMWVAFRWIKNGLYSPKRNWEEGIFRIGFVIEVLVRCAIVLVPVGGSFYITLKKTGNIEISVVVAVVMLIIMLIINWIITGFTDGE